MRGPDRRRASRGGDADGIGPGSAEIPVGAWHLRCFERSTPLPIPMNADNDNAPKLPDALSSVEYRTRLATKLNCLIAVLEVAIAKITKSMDVPGANEERLLKIRGNLENTLSICHRAKQTLDRSAAPKVAAKADDARSMTARDYVELTSIDEYRKFRTMDPISKEDLAAIDFEELARRLTQG